MGTSPLAVGWLRARSTTQKHHSADGQGSSQSSLAPALRFSQEQLRKETSVILTGCLGGEETLVLETEPLGFLEMQTRRAGWGCADCPVLPGLLGLKGIKTRGAARFVHRSWRNSWKQVPWWGWE